jgi:hypothetical protein
VRDPWTLEDAPPTGGYVAAALGSLLGLALLATGTAAILAEGDPDRLGLYVTGDPRGLLELEGIGIILSVAAGAVGAPIGAGLALRLRHHGAAALSGSWAFPAAVLLLSGAYSVGSLFPPVFPWAITVAALLAGLAGRGMGLAIIGRGTRRSAA